MDEARSGDRTSEKAEQVRQDGRGRGIRERGGEQGGVVAGRRSWYEKPKT